MEKTYPVIDNMRQSLYIIMAKLLPIIIYNYSWAVYCEGPPWLEQE